VLQERAHEPLDSSNLSEAGFHEEIDKLLDNSGPIIQELSKGLEKTEKGDR
jgi:hypothetical protein